MVARRKPKTEEPVKRKKRKKKKKMGRPTEYTVKYNKQAYKLCLLGAIDEDLADFFQVSGKTINVWKRKHPKFKEAIRKGKEYADANVAEALYQRAMGFEHEEEKIFQFKGKVVRATTNKKYPPDTPAIIHWLNNRRPDLWKNKNDHNLHGPNDGPIETITRTIVDPKEK